MSLLPTQGPEARSSQEGELRVVGVDEDVSEVFEVLSSETAREVLNAIYAEPGTPSEIADRLGMSIQKVSYHLENLEDAELISVAGTRYSEKGQEMNVYEPPPDPMVVFVGTRDRKESLKALVKRLLPGVGVLALASLAVQGFADQLPLAVPGGAGGADGVQAGEGADGGASSGSLAEGGGETTADTGDGGGDALDAADGSGNVTATSGDDGAGIMDAGEETATARETTTAADGATTTDGGDAGVMDVGGTATGTPAPEATPGATGTPVDTATPATDGGAVATPTGTPVRTETATPVADTAASDAAPTGTPPAETGTELAARGTEIATEASASGAAGLDPGVAFFLGGLFALAMVSVVYLYRN